ncbi:hypothetical protein LAWI1_G003629 [Lachnellula willkommii]|uniref:Uncharacterized protein n=1 Tax=Lachnellula willkommii TaxID=215461 RepID=A0A559ME33_9HELO|nr:hypothetical protein LAWI1_G003629 [Lachnellula willkommii]
MASQATVRRKPVPSLIQSTYEPQYALLDNPAPVEIVSPEKLVADHGDDGQAHYFSKSVKSHLRRPFAQRRYQGIKVESDEWQISDSQYWWIPIVWMLVWILIGILVGLGHHFAYRSLHEQPQSVFSQTWIHNIGTGAAFLVKSSFTLSVLTALQEILWFSFRQKAMKVSLLDKLFSLTSNPLCFGPSALINAPLATTLAAFAWIIPLSAILSPGSLTVTPLVHRNDSTCVVPTFAAASNNVSFWRIIPHGSTIYGPNAGINKLAGQVLAQGTILESKSPCGSNCSFQHSFDGPGLRCQNASNPSYLTADDGQETFWLSYNSTTYWNSTFGSGNTTMANLMTYRNNTKAQAGERSGYTTILCLAYNATYNVFVNYTNGVPGYTTNLTYNAPLESLNMTESMGYGSPWHTNSAMLVLEIFNNYLDGTWQQTPTTQYSIPDTSITQTTLAGDTDDANHGTAASLWFINQDLRTGVPELLTNLTLSTLAFSPVSTVTRCSVSMERLVYYYNPKLLLIPYSIALLLSLVALAVGVWVLRKTGVRTGQIFSQILVTTRNPQLDEISRGNSLSSADASALMQQKLMFGELKRGADGGKTRHAAFGSAEQLITLTGRKIS